ncbi:MAG: hypothetical protein EP306_00590 [Burkholderiales bacterium]|nr:MAG: hypothetical protein EP306_00590 [Burkholderiales bacterium]
MGRPGGRPVGPHAPPLRGSLPPEGAGLPWGGPAAGLWPPRCAGRHVPGVHVAMRQDRRAAVAIMRP